MDTAHRDLSEKLAQEYLELENHLQDSVSQVRRLSAMKKAGSMDPNKRDIHMLRQLEAEQQITDLEIRTCHARIERFKLEIELLS